MIGVNRRRVMGGMNMDKYLIKTVTLDVSHENDVTGNPVYWSTFLEIPVVTDNTDRNLYLCVFDNNNAARTDYKTDFILYYRIDNDRVNCLYVRNNRNTTSYGFVSATSLYASVGTVIKVYKIPAV